MALKVGDVAPDFELMNQDKNKVKLSDYRGKKQVMLLFYPMDFSPVCTAEHCAFGPSLPDAVGADTVVFGINCDHPFSHAAFRKQYNLPYDLLSDTTRKVVQDYGMFMGVEPYNCAKRGTVVIGTDGKIRHYEEVPTKDERTLSQLSQVGAIDAAINQRKNEGGDAV